MFSGSTTGWSQPSDVKCDIPANVFDDEGDGAEEEAVVVVVEEEEEEEEEEDCAPLVEEDVVEEEEKVAAVVPFVVKSARRVRSACETNFVLPVRTARR